MAHYTKIHHQAKTRSNFNQWKYRTDCLKRTLNIQVTTEPQIRRFKSYCQISNTARSYYSMFALSRHVLRREANFGYIIGLSKSSW